MLSIRNINPMVRAIGTMGAVAALVGGITFAQIPSNTVTLQNNTLVDATASLGIGLTQNCTDETLGPVDGMDFTNLQPTVTSPNFDFCLDNTGGASTGAPMYITMSVPSGAFTGSTINANDITLGVSCGVGGSYTGVVSYSGSLGGLSTTPVQLSTTPLSNASNNVWSCEANVTPDSSVTTSGGSITPFSIDFAGTTVDT